MPNPLQSLRALLAGPPQQVGLVVAIDGSVATVELPDGSQIKARGSATVGQYVFEQAGQILGDAPTLPIDIIEI